MSIKEMESRKKELLRALQLLGTDEAPDRPVFLKHIDREILERLACPLPSFDTAAFAVEIDQWIRELCRLSEAAHRRILSFDLEFIEQVTTGEEDLTQRGPFGLIQGAFPVRLQNRIVSCVWTGKMLDRPLTGRLLEEAAREAACPVEKMADLVKNIPVFTSDQLDRIFSLHRQLRDTIQQSLTSHLSLLDLHAQLLESERVRSLGSLSGGIAHHFNNLLSVILGYSSFLLNREDMPGDAEQALKQISEAAQRGRRLTQEVLAFAGSEVETESLCSVHEILSSVLSLLETQTARVRVNTDLRAANDTVSAPKSSIHQIVFNLLSNAIDSIPGGGILSVSTNNVDIPVGDQAIPHLRIEVLDTDTSGAIGPEGRATGQSPRLSSLYGIVNKLEGSAVISREAGHTNKAEVLLPVAGKAESRKPEKARRRRLTPSRIWVVDDDPIFRQMCIQVLSEDGHTVEELSSGTELLEKWKNVKEHPHLLIIDFSMPEYNGLELCEWLKKQGSRASIILVSGFAPTQPDIHKALQMRKTYFLQKPFPVPELGDAVTVALGETLLGE